ncbi:MAG TPA: flagellar filament capping protein FliD [Phycisphaerae bacterium]|nr:flagellar filament capping protein FliD [Phycisphaerae bacterium]HNU46387.1 flagellar filament capping protein FliD [Phycisphaerae bacterium]
MATVTTGVGLISGIDYATLIKQYMAIESVPITNLKTRVTAIDTQRTALADVAARLLSVKNTALGFGKLSFFQRYSAASSNSEVLTASAGTKATPASYNLRVHALATNHALLSRGFADADRAPVGAGTITIEVGQGSINAGTELNGLNGGAGIRRGTFTITDRTGASAQIDVSAAVTVADVLNAINSAGLNVRARVTSLPTAGATGDRIVLEDFTAADKITGNLVVADPTGGRTAADLGLVGNVAAGRIDGADLVRLTMDTPLAALNDGNGVDRLRDALGTSDLTFQTSYGNFNVSLTSLLQTSTSLSQLNHGQGVRLGVIRITDRTGRSAEVDLSQAKTAGDVLNALRGTDLAISVTIVNSRFQVADTSSVPDAQKSNLIVEDVSGHAAADLGIAGSVAGSVSGSDVYSVSTLGDVVRAINYASGNAELVRASLSATGDGLILTAFGIGNTVTVTAAGGSQAARDLGLLDATFDSGQDFQSRRLVAGLNTVLLQTLNGGSGVNLGTVTFTDRAGNSTIGGIDFSSAQTLQDVIDLINDDGRTGFVASVNATGTGIELRDESGGTGLLSIVDVTGTTAADLGIAVTQDPGNPFTGGVVSSGNLQRQYVSRQTALSSLNGGRGIALGSFRVTDSKGAVVAVNLGYSGATNVGHLIDAINASFTTAGAEHLQARLNDTGDGLLIVDTSGGSGSLSIEDAQGGTTAAGLRLAGTARTGENFIDGSYEIRIDVNATDTLQTLVKKLNSAGGDFTAAVFNDGSALRPYSLTLTSNASGRAGALVLSTTGIDLGLQALTEARDAAVTFGGAGSTDGLFVTSSSNTVENLVEGVTFNLLNASPEQVTVTVNQDVDSIVQRIKTFVEAFNSVQDGIDSYTSFNSETYARGTLFGDATVESVRNRLLRVFLRTFEDVPTEFSRPVNVGLALGSGNQLEFDEDKFRDAYAANPKDVETLFTQADTGFAAVLDDLLDELTRSSDGVLARHEEQLTKQQDNLNDRITALQTLVDAKQARLEAQFTALESVLSNLQSQQSALTSLANLVSNM